MTTAALWIVRRRATGRKAAPAVLVVSSLLFGASATLTIAWGAAMSATGGMPMPGGWTMSMAWMRMPGQTWGSATASWLGMWVVMMVAMMLPSLVPTLYRYREAVTGDAEEGVGMLTALVSLGYFCVWTLVGMVAFPLGLALAQAEMRHPGLSRAVPIASAVIVLIAGACQFTEWKAHHLACCRDFFERRCSLPADAGLAWRQGLRLGRHCSYSTAGLTAILLVMGVMDLRVMAAVTTAVTAERLAPTSERVARAVGIIVISAGLVLLARAARLR